MILPAKNSCDMTLRLIILPALLLIVFLLPFNGQEAQAASITSTVNTVSADSEGAFDEREALAVSEASIGSPLGRYAFVDSSGQVRPLSSFIGKPLIISLIYTGCVDVCPTVSEQLAHAVEVAQETFGVDAFAVATIGFDADNDTPARMKSFAASHGINIENWYFLSGEAATIERFADDLGFLFFPSAAGFQHMTRTTVVDAEGVVYRHIYGVDIAPPHLMEPMKDLIYGRVAAEFSLEGIINRVKLFCTIYDPRAGRYSFDYSIFITMSAGMIAFIGFGVVLFRIWLANRRDRHHAKHV